MSRGGLVRRRWLSIANLLAFAAAGVLLALLLVRPSYQLEASYVLSYPAEGPSAALQKAASENPFLRYNDTTTVAQTLAARMSGGSVREQLQQDVNSITYTVSTSSELNASGQIIDVQVEAVTTQEARAGLKALQVQTAKELLEMQTSEGANPRALITIAPAAIPGTPSPIATEQVRSVVGVLGIAIVIGFLIIQHLERRDETGKATRRLRRKGKL